MSRLRVVVVGAGHLGTYHMQKVREIDAAELVGVVEIDPECCERLRADGLRVEANLGHFAGAADAAIIAAPTSAHARLAHEALALGWHVLVEKPITATVAEGEALVAEATATGRVLQVGHTERFNPAVAAALRVADRPRYIVSERLGPFTGRSTDVDVILDLMIHDLDIVASLIPSDVVEVRAIGVPVLTQAVDMAAARLAFADGSVAQLSAGRASMEPSRKIRLFTVERYVSIDCAAREVKSVRRLPPASSDGWPQISGEPVEVPEGDALALQDQDFVRCALEGSEPRVSGAAGLRALRLAAAVEAAMQVPDFADPPAPHPPVQP